jgi:hypothetical protein
MKKITTGLGIMGVLLLSISAEAQYAYDALRFSESDQIGTARFQAIGGNQVSLGGDATSIVGNPAGLGFYSRSEISISPALRSVNSTSTFVGNTTKESTVNGSLANLSLVIAHGPKGFESNWKGTSFGISYSSKQSLRNTFSYRDPSSRAPFVYFAVENANYYQESLALDNGIASSVEAAYYNLNMINPTTPNGTTYESFDAANQRPVNQRGLFESKGVSSQWTFAYGGNYKDKLYLGFSVGITRTKYSFTNNLTDQFASGQEFSRSSHIESFSLDGNGINATLGAIYKVSPIFQVGGTLTTPTFSVNNETFSGTVTADRDWIDLKPNDFTYSLTTPFKASGGVTVFAGQNGFITGSIEYVGYRGMRVGKGDATFKEQNNTEIKSIYNNVVNGRIGGEYRAGKFRGRLGLAYLSDPYAVKTDGTNHSKILLSAGMGVRSQRFFADLTGTYGLKTDFVAPKTDNYVNDPRDRITNQTVNVMVTAGVFF